MTLAPTQDHVGTRIRRRRIGLGKTVRQTAAEAGISHSTLSRMERGEVGTTDRFKLAAIAQALRCPVEQLAGTIVPAGRDGAETTAAAYQTLTAIISADLEFPPTCTTTLPIEALTDRFDTAIERRQTCDYAALTRQLPALVDDLYAATAGPHRVEALGMLARVAEAASFAVRYTGQSTAAHVASDLARQASLLTEDPVLIGFGEWARAHTALGCGLHERAVQLTARAVADLDAAPHAPGKQEMLGMLYLTHAFAQVGAGRFPDAADPIAEATVLARITGETDTLALMFGPTNLRLWELAIVTDGGDPLDAMPILADINPAVIPSKSRQVCFYSDGARAAAKLGNIDQAVQLLSTAERIAPQRVHGDPIIVETVRSLLDHTRRVAAGDRLRGLAQRMSVA
jgi:transcriptional regulator with XRE-family HTH domain